MDEPGWQWPAWKFGMKRSDLFTKLHDQYNTLLTPIQDPEAFHHDVYEISNVARSKDEFHHLLAERKEQRLDELNNGLELASVKIISNPNLIGTEQWPMAIQLFRARSLDALVRYFSSYLPEHQYDSDAETIDTHSVRSDMSSTTSISTASTDVNSEAPSTTAFFTEKQMVAHEPLTITTNITVSPSSKRQAPLSPADSHIDFDDAATSPAAVESQQDDEDFVLNRPTTPVSRSMSFSGSESDRFTPYHHDDDVPSEADTPSSLDETESVHDVYEPDINPSRDDDPAEIEPNFSQPHDTLDTTPVSDISAAPDNKPQTTSDMESDTPTPRPDLNHEATSYMSAKLAAHLRRSPSPSPRTRLAHCEARKSPRMRKRELSPVQVSRSPCEVLSRIQKPLPDQMRCRTIRGRKRMEVD
ncbi:hypothetical protein MKZ38_010678 [Zalerion maritima]|uniref:Uncharacterized protein n=1 Tax=Zalerion maritima TaxID=339359 RepID=A0AAD5RJH0_9PEZI|nr:hypothetical protein MKZ38_010678 [Zalerion maritima]